ERGSRVFSRKGPHVESQPHSASGGAQRRDPDRLLRHAKMLQSRIAVRSSHRVSLRPLMPASAALTATAPSDIAWRLVGLVNRYRLLVPLVLLSVDFRAGPQVALSTQPDLLLSFCVGYFFVGVLMVVARRLSWPSIRRVALLNATVDAAAIALILYACG